MQVTRHGIEIRTVPTETILHISHILHILQEENPPQEEERTQTNENEIQK